jgi:ligand-binding SRPBCC domain-containing protein
MPTELTVSARYNRPADRVFAEALSFAEMAHATRGVAVYKDMPQGSMEQGRTYTLNVTVWGIMRNPNYQVHVERVDPVARTVQSREFGWMIRQWDHTLSVVPDGDGCVWTDRIVIDCSWATGYMSWVAKVLYRTRHRNRQGQDITAHLRRV